MDNQVCGQITRRLMAWLDEGEESHARVARKTSSWNRTQEYRLLIVGRESKN